MNVKNRTLFTADNLDVMRGMDSESVDLIYLDPPFNSNRTYSAPVGSKAAGAAFKDSWTLSDVDVAWVGLIADQESALAHVIEGAGLAHGKGMQSYLTMMAVRLLEMRRLLKQTGSIYLHCDPTASHYLKMVLDCVFGQKNFRNELVWGYNKPRPAKKQYVKNHDILLFYSNSNQWAFTPQRVPTLDGKFTLRKPFKRPDGSVWAPKEPSKLCGSWWYDIASFSTRVSAKERTGYPTQKPLALLDRILKASSNEGDMVLDPFAGCATTCVAAELLGRKWVGIDLSKMAATLVRSRLQQAADDGALLKEAKLPRIHHRTDIPKRSDSGDLRNYRLNKHVLYGQQEGNCTGCGVHFPFRNFTVDHIVPQAKGGTDHPDNLQLLCGACNSTKGTSSQAELLVKLRNRGVIPQLPAFRGN